ncbi:MAG TPA: hypothetical protein PKE64_30375 [Anaerolineae bacterium]|nr:hypothetical protein [Anaerolineae bacterium]
MNNAVAPTLPEVKARQRTMADLQGLLSPAERKSSGQLAEAMGDVTRYGFQNVLDQRSN